MLTGFTFNLWLQHSEGHTTLPRYPTSLACSSSHFQTTVSYLLFSLQNSYTTSSTSQLTMYNFTSYILEKIVELKQLPHLPSRNLQLFAPMLCLRSYYCGRRCSCGRPTFPLVLWIPSSVSFLRTLSLQLLLLTCILKDIPLYNIFPVSLITCWHISCL